MKRIFTVFLIIILSKTTYSQPKYTKSLKVLTDIMVFDVTSPVASARYYAYTTLAAYEALSLTDTLNYPSILKTLNLPFHGFKANDNIEKNLLINLTLLNSGVLLLPSGQRINPYIDSLKSEYLINEDLKIWESCSFLAMKLSEHIKSIALQDGFRQLNNLKKYTPQKGEGFWQPTGPVFMPPVEPNWSTVKTFFIKDLSQYAPKPPTPFSLNQESEFYKQMKEVYLVVNRKNKKEQLIAEFWDCNPYAISQIGHVEFGLKKISPGGHWMGIAGIACNIARLNVEETAKTHAWIALTLHDAFVACWDEKYRSDRVRPETVIKKNLDPTWRPLLQTPPFPEYVSGHSVASTAAAQLLTHFFGNRFKFTDNTEIEFGLPIRKFKSFKSAADEACISRLYGGIHFRDAIDLGKWQGEKVASTAMKIYYSMYK